MRDLEAAHDGPVIVPMTLVRDDYFDEIVGQLRADGVDVRHYALRARLAYVGGRLLDHETWAIQRSTAACRPCPMRGMTAACRTPDL
jgi:hypothetical protein